MRFCLFESIGDSDWIVIVIVECAYTFRGFGSKVLWNGSVRFCVVLGGFGFRSVCFLFEQF